MTECSEEQAAPKTHADMDDDQASIEAELDDFEALIRSIHDAHAAGTPISALRAQLEPIISQAGAGPLLGLKPAIDEKAGDITADAEDVSDDPRYNPLLGTILVKATENSGKSSIRRSPEPVCYDNVLRVGSDDPTGKSQEPAKRTPRGRYGFKPGLLPKGMFVRRGRYYLRRHVPCDLQPLIGRLEVWP